MLLTVNLHLHYELPIDNSSHGEERDILHLMKNCEVSTEKQSTKLSRGDVDWPILCALLFEAISIPNCLDAAIHIAVVLELLQAKDRILYC